MSKFRRDEATETGIDIGSVLMANHHRTPSAHFRIWTASFGRIISDALSCGASSYRFRDDFAGERISRVPDIPPEKSALSRPRNGKSETLSDLLSIAEAENEEETKRKVEELESMEAVVRELQFDESRRNWMRRGEAARKVRTLAKEDLNARSTLAMLGAIPPLVSMLDLDQMEDDGLQCIVDSLYALLNIGIGNDSNKAAIVKAGAVHKMLKITETLKDRNESVSEAIVANFLGLSALDSNKPIIGSSGAIPFLVEFLKNGRRTSQPRLDAFKALYNLSIHPPNIAILLETDLIAFLMSAIGDMEVSERILLILSNVVAVPEGRKAISGVGEGIPILVDVLHWNDSPTCQEIVSYILMVMAHKAYGDRRAMIEAGVVSALLELTLLGSTLAQKRASRILECLTVEKGKSVSDGCGGNASFTVSAPFCGSSSSTFGEFAKEDMMSEENKAVKHLVEQSLQSNMRRIAKRANLPQVFSPSDHFKSLSVSSTSKSLPF